MAKNPNLWFVAAGTGGHIFPGLALANEVRKGLPNAEILFFGTRDRLEAKLVPGAGYPIKFLKAAPWKGANPFARLWSLGSLVVGFSQVLLLGLKKRPDLLVSVGGYVSMPTALACRVLGVPLVILEPNIRAGLANRLMSHFARRAFCAPGSDAIQRLSCPVADSGNPVRNDLRPVEIRERVKRILILGGSQGARSLCKASLQVARDLDLGNHGIELLLQSGENNLADSRKWQKEFGVSGWTQVVPFIDDIPAALAQADVVVARAGAMTVAELSVAGLPTIFVPFPFAADDHQKVNAKLLADAQAAHLVDERDGNLEMMLDERLRDLCVNPGNLARRRELSENFRKHARPAATQNIAKELLSLAAEA